MGNPQSKATEKMTASDVPPGIFSYKICYTCQTPSPTHNEIVSTECVAGPMEGTNVDDYKPEIYPSGQHKLMLFVLSIIPNILGHTQYI